VLFAAVTHLVEGLITIIIIIIINKVYRIARNAIWEESEGGGGGSSGTK
jgi:chromate transport protein ChrA